MDQEQQRKREEIAEEGISEEKARLKSLTLPRSGALPPSQASTSGKGLVRSPDQLAERVSLIYIIINICKTFGFGAL